MTKLATLAAASAAALLACAGAAAAQDVVISNARIIVGDGRVIEKGSLVVRGGKIASVTAGAAPRGAAGQRIDGTGKTVMAGFIDLHRHLVYGPADKYLAEQAADRMRELLEAGFTTVQSGGDDNAGVAELKRRVDSGQIKGPHIISSYRIATARMASEEEARAGVRAAVAAKADSMAEVHYPTTPPPAVASEQETKNLAAALDEARKLGIPFQIHAISPKNMVDAVGLGARKLIHTPHWDWVTEADAKVVKDAGAVVASCTGFGPPVFDVFTHDNKPAFRDGKPWPQGIVSNEGQGREAGLLPVNGRTLFDAGVTYGYCTDTTYDATMALNQELKTLNLTFSMLDIIKIMGPNSARFLDREKELGTLEAGKNADVVVLGANPLVGYWNMLTTEVVLKDGVVVVDKRARPNAGKPFFKPTN